MWKKYNPNPLAVRVGDCTVRAISRLLDQEWEKTYIDLCTYGLMRCDMPSANSTWGAYLKSKGCKRHLIPDECSDYTVADFARDHATGKYLLALNGHVVTIDNGDWYDTWDSGQEVPIYYWQKEG